MWYVTLIALACAFRAWRRVRMLEARSEEQSAAIERLAKRLARVESGRRPEQDDAAAAAAAERPEADVVPPPVPPRRPEPEVEAEPPVVRPAPVVPPPPVVPPAPTVAPPPIAPPPPSAAPEPPPVRPAPPPPPRVTPPPPRPPVGPPPRTIDWEGLVGVNLFSWIAGAALVLAAVFFLRYSIDRGWLGPSIRMAIGLLTGVGLLVGCELRAARKYPTTANALDAAGIATLFATLFASHALWDLIPEIPTFLAMALVAAVAVVLSIRRDSVFIALLGLLGGFATPALLSTGENRPIGLFGYLLVLNVGLAWVAYERGWVILTIGSVVLTTLYQFAWVAKFLHESPLPLAMAIFLLFPIVQVGALLLAKREQRDDTSFGGTTTIAAIVPLIFSLYLAAVPSYGAHMALLFGFVLVIGIGLTLVAAVRGPLDLHLIGALGTVLAFILWCATSYGSQHWPWVLVWVTLAVALYLAAPWVVARFGRDLGTAGRNGHIAAASLLAVGVFLAWTEPAVVSPWTLFGTMLLLATEIAVVAVATEDGTPYLVAAGLVFSAEVVWSMRFLAPERRYSALTLYTVFGLFHVGVPLLAARNGRRLVHGAGSAVMLVASIALLLFLAAGPVAHVALGGLAALLGLFSAALFLPAITGPYPMVRAVGLLVGWLVIGTWWATAMTAALLLPALLVVGGMSVLIALGHTWLGGLGGPVHRDDDSFVFGAALATIVHFFLAWVVLRPELGVPPWPWLAVLGVIDLAIATTALASRDGRPHLVAVVASQLVILLWGTHATTGSWPSVAMLAADGVVALALVWIVLAGRRGIDRGIDRIWFAAAAVGGILVAQAITILAAEAVGAPAVGWIMAQHAALLIALLAVADAMEWNELRRFAVVPGALASALWVTAHVPERSWLAGMAFAVMPFVVLYGAAFRVDPRGSGALPAYQALVGAGAVFLALARHILRTVGWQDVIGIVPVAQALAILALLRRVVARRTGPVARDGHVALIAAATLGFATAAIPLQLSLEHLTVALALEAAALAWLHRRIRFPQLVLWVAGLGAAVFIRLTVNPDVLEYHPRSATPIFNWYLYVYLVSAMALFAAASFVRDADDTLPVIDWKLSDLLSAAAAILLFLLVNIEIADFYSTGPTLTFNIGSASLAQGLTYTIAWAMFAIGLLVAGIRAGSRVVRLAALTLLVVTIFKCFVSDLWRLGGLYRVGSLVGLAISLSLVAVLLQRFVFLPKEEEGARLRA